MSASCSSESSETKNSPEPSSNIKSRYALYLFSNNKHAGNSDNCDGKENANNVKNDLKSPDIDELSFCLSLVEGNLGAEQETVVRCYLLKTLSGREDLRFENEGKYATLQFSDDSDEPFGCYYHRLSKNMFDIENNVVKDGISPSKMYTFFICLIGPANGIMESFCAELGIFCHSLIHLLDPEGLKNQERVQLKLQTWYFYCIEYINRCVQLFKEDLAYVLYLSLLGNAEIVVEDEDNKWDLERLVETCSLMPKSTSIIQDINPELNSTKMKIVDGKIVNEKNMVNSYCLRWYEKLKSCHPDDHASLHNILDGFRLKAIQDLNTLKRLLQKAETDHYSLYRAYQFLRASGYEDILLHHVKQETSVAGQEEILEVISCLQDFIKCKSTTSV